MKILLKLMYDGYGFAGYQVQPSKITVQSAIQDAIEKVYGERYDVKGCSRTDAGVHALKYFVTFDTDKSIPYENIPYALNSVCDKRISFLGAYPADDSFHVRYDVEYKEYEYLFLWSKAPNPFYNNRCFHVKKKLTDDILSKMELACSCFVGKHDFAGFMSSGSDVTDTIREVYYCKIIADGNFVRLRIAADGFLYNMVRIIAGTVLDCGYKKIDANKIPEIIKSCNRDLAGSTLSPGGLYLKDVVFKSGKIKGM